MLLGVIHSDEGGSGMYLFSTFVRALSVWPGGPGARPFLPMQL